MNAHIPRKRFGQHFLHDPGILRRIVDAIAPRPDQRIVEIGPGEGAAPLALRVQVDAALAAFETQAAKLDDIATGRFAALSERSQAFRTELDGHEIEMLAEYFGTTAQVLMGFETEPRPRKPMSPEQWCAHRGSNPGPED